MKKILVLLILAALLLSACGGQSPAPKAEAPAASPSSGEASPPAGLSPAAAELSALFGELRENVSIGTAGSSLRTAAMAARLLDWAEGKELSDEEILAVLALWLDKTDDSIPASFPEQLGAVYGMVLVLTGPDAAQARGLLSDAGCENCGYPWSDGAVALVERIMTLAGLRADNDGN